MTTHHITFELHLNVQTVSSLVAHAGRPLTGVGC